MSYWTARGLRREWYKSGVNCGTLRVSPPLHFPASPLSCDSAAAWPPAYPTRIAPPSRHHQPDWSSDQPYWSFSASACAPLWALRHAVPYRVSSALFVKNAPGYDRPKAAGLSRHAMIIGHQGLATPPRRPAALRKLGRCGSSLCGRAHCLHQGAPRL